MEKLYNLHHKKFELPLCIPDGGELSIPRGERKPETTGGCMTEDNESPGLVLCGCGACSAAHMRFPCGQEYPGITDGCVTEDVTGLLINESP